MELDKFLSRFWNLSNFLNRYTRLNSFSTRISLGILGFTWHDLKCFLRQLEFFNDFKIWGFKLTIKLIRNEIAIDIFTPRRDLLSISYIFLSRFSPCFAGNSVTDTLRFLCFSTAVTCLSFSPSFHPRDESFHQTKQFGVLFTEKQ